jgi:flagellar basal-body rod modification protein FlgD
MLNGSGLGTVAKPKLLDDATRAKLGLPSTAATSAAKAKQSLDGTANGLGKDDFMKLLLAQMGNQDPMKPMEDKEFIAQLAQFNSLEQMQQVNKGIQQLATAQQMTDANLLLGRRVQAFGAEGVITGEVRAVTMVSGKPMLRIGTEEVALSDVSRILMPGEPATVSGTGSSSSSNGTTTTTQGTAPIG